VGMRAWVPRGRDVCALDVLAFSPLGRSKAAAWPGAFRGFDGTS
jgi:hypothetical protein